MATWIAIIALIPIVGVAWLKIGRSKSIRREAERAQGKVLERLSAAAGAVGGRVVDGRWVETGFGRLELIASGAPERTVVDLTKFTGPLKSAQVLHLVPMADADKVLPLKVLHRVTVEDPRVAEAYVVYASDDAIAKAVAVGELAEALAQLDRQARVKSRLQVSPGGTVVVALRGLSRPEDLKAFHDGAAGVAEIVRSRLPGAGAEAKP